MIASRNEIACQAAVSALMRVDSRESFLAMVFLCTTPLPAARCISGCAACSATTASCLLPPAIAASTFLTKVRMRDFRAWLSTVRLTVLPDALARGCGIGHGLACLLVGTVGPATGAVGRERGVLGIPNMRVKEAPRLTQRLRNVPSPREKMPQPLTPAHPRCGSAHRARARPSHGTPRWRSPRRRQPSATRQCP